MDELNQLISEHVKELNYCVRLNVIYLGVKRCTRIGSLLWRPKCRYVIERGDFYSPKITDDYFNYNGVYNHYKQLFSSIGVEIRLPQVPVLEGLETETEGLESETPCLQQYLPEVGSLDFSDVKVNIKVSTNDNDLCIKRGYYCGLKGKDSYRVYDVEFLLEQVLELIGSLNSVIARNSNTKSARNI